MSKHTTTLFEIIKSELINSGHNEFFNEKDFVFYDDDFSFIKKAMRYDEDVQKIVNKKIFQGFTFKDKQMDLDFKKTFVNSFLDYEIGFQTIEAFSMKVLKVTLSYQKYLETIYLDFDKFMNGLSETNSTGENENTDDNRRLNSDLPQDNINLNVDNTILNYGNENEINRNRQKGITKTNSKNNVYSLGTLEKMKELFADVFNIYEQKCFLHVW